MDDGVCVKDGRMREKQTQMKASSKLTSHHQTQALS